MIEQSYKLNLIPDRVIPLVKVSQFDTARRIRFYLFNGDSEYTPTGTVKILIGTNQFNATIDGNSVYFTVPTSITRTVQKLFGEVVIGSTLGTCNFNLEVEKTPLENVSLMMSNNPLRTETPLETDENEPEEETEEETEEPIEEEPIEEETEPIEEENEDELVNDNTDNRKSRTRES